MTSINFGSSQPHYRYRTFEFLFESELIHKALEITGRHFRFLQKLCSYPSPPLRNIAATDMGVNVKTIERYALVLSPEFLIEGTLDVKPLFRNLIKHLRAGGKNQATGDGYIGELRLRLGNAATEGLTRSERAQLLTWIRVNYLRGSFKPDAPDLARA